MWGSLMISSRFIIKSLNTVKTCASYACHPLITSHDCLTIKKRNYRIEYLNHREVRDMNRQKESNMNKPALNVFIAKPRGFCAGVHRAILIVEKALEKFGKPVYVRHEIVHNRFVVESLEAKGAIFVDELDNVPDDAPVVFSAHGVPKSVPAEAERRKLMYVDATCPLVSKVHSEADRHVRLNRHTILIGHAGHPEVIGTLGQVEDGQMTLIETVADIDALSFPEEQELAYVTQTNLSVEDTSHIIEALRKRFPNIAGPKKEDICYATTNRQEAAKEIAKHSDKVLVIGAPNSSNSLRLVEVSIRNGAEAKLIERAKNLDMKWLEGVKNLGITAGASAPEVLVEEVISALRDSYDVHIEGVQTSEENISFKLPAIFKESA